MKSGRPSDCGPRGGPADVRRHRTPSSPGPRSPGLEKLLHSGLCNFTSRLRSELTVRASACRVNCCRVNGLFLQGQWTVVRCLFLCSYLTFLSLKGLGKILYGQAETPF